MAYRSTIITFTDVYPTPIIKSRKIGTVEPLALYAIVYLPEFLPKNTFIREKNVIGVIRSQPIVQMG